MADVYIDRARETTVSTGTGTITLAGAVAQFQAIAGIGNGATARFTLVDANGTGWQMFRGTYSSGANTVTRDSTFSSSNGGSNINLSAGTHQIYISPDSTGFFANPMSTGGDLIYGGASGVATRLPNGIVAGELLLSGGGTAAPSWSGAGLLYDKTLTALSIAGPAIIGSTPAVVGSLDSTARLLVGEGTYGGSLAPIVQFQFTNTDQRMTGVESYPVYIANAADQTHRIYGHDFGTTFGGTKNFTEGIGFSFSSLTGGSGSIAKLYTFYFSSFLDNSRTVGDLYEVAIKAPVITGTAAITGTAYGIWEEARGGVAPNVYSFWSDEQGVYRIKSDNTFDSVYQAIPALYNPLFTKYTPGAANHERIVQYWKNNGAYIGAEKGGTGVLEALHLLGAGLTSNGFLKTSGADGTLSVDTTAYSTFSGAYADLTGKPTLGTLAAQNGTFSGTSSGTNTGDQTFASLSPLTTKGDLLGFSTVNGRLGVGADAFVLTADAASTFGFKWAAAAGGASAPFTDASALVKNSADATKLAIFSAAGITTGTTRTYTLPNVSDTLAVLGANTFTTLQTHAIASANTGVIASTGYSLTGSDATGMVSLAGTLNTSGAPVMLKIALTNTASGATTKFASFLAGAAGATEMFSVAKTGLITTASYVLSNIANAASFCIGGGSTNFGYFGNDGGRAFSLGYASGAGVLGTAVITYTDNAGITLAPVAGAVTIADANGRSLKIPGMAVANLPATPVRGMTAYVTDSNAASYAAGIGAVVAAGGSTVVPVFYDGTNWRIG